MSYQFPSDIQARLDAFLQAGTFQSEDDAIRGAMDAFEQLEAEKLQRWHEQNQLAEAQSVQGLSRPLDEERVIARLRKRLEKDGIVE